MTPLFGREAEFVEILNLLRESKLVTLTGPGGVGKTALAQTLARWFWDTERETQTNPRGIVFVGLDALSSGSGLADYVRARPVPDSPPPATEDPALRREDAVRVISNALNRHARLVVLHNFESAMDGGAGQADALEFVTGLVSALNNHVRFLITSRHALHPQTGIEKMYEIEPLADPDALDLFYARAGDTLRRNAATIADASEICRLVDNLPLGVELAARNYSIGSRPLPEIRQGLRVTPFDIDAADALGYPERQRGLIASFRYTFNHLTPAAQRLFTLMHIFRGSAGRDAIDYIADDKENWHHALAELVNWNLVEQDRTPDPWRYSMLATTEAFSRYQFQNNPTAPPVTENDLRHRHAEYYVTVAARFDELPMQRWREIEDTDWENIKAGADWAADELEAREGATVDELLARIDELPVSEGAAGLAGEFGYQLFTFVYWRRTLEGRRWLGAGLVDYHFSNNQKNNALLCNELGVWFKSRGDYAAALGWYEKSGKILEDLGDAAGLATTYNNIGLIHDSRGDYAAALTWYEKSINIKEETGDAAGLAATYNNIATIHYARGDYAAALEWFEKSVKIKEEIGDAAGLAATYNNIGLIHGARGLCGGAGMV